MGDMRKLIFGHRQPAQPVGFVGVGPERRVASPQAAHLLALFPFLNGRFHPGFKIGRQLPRHLGDFWG